MAIKVPKLQKVKPISFITNLDPYLDEVREIDENQESIDQIVAETISKSLHIQTNNTILGLYDPSHYLWDEIYEFYKYMEGYKAYQVVTIDNKYNIIFGCEILQEKKDICIKLSCWEERDGTLSKLEDYTFILKSIRPILKLLNAKDVISYDKPLKLIRDFKEYVRLFIFSFILYDPEQTKKGEESIQIKWSTKGLLIKEIHIHLFKRECAIVLKYLKEQTFRMTWYFIGKGDDYMTRGISIDIKWDNTAYAKFFKEINVEKILEKNPQYREHMIMPSHLLIDGEVRLKTFKAGN